MSKLFSDKELQDIMYNIDFVEEFDTFQDSDGSNIDKNYIQYNHLATMILQENLKTHVLDDAFTSENEEFNGENEKKTKFGIVI